MLVLTRKEKETIQVGSSITIRVSKIKGNKVQLGIEAPADVKILRSELSFMSPAEEEHERHHSEAVPTDADFESREGAVERLVTAI